MRQCDGKECIITIEDPVEYELKGVSQIQIDPNRNQTFDSTFRAILRQNPDVILGEIRDSDSATVAVNASSTGRLVFSTLHANDAANAIPRLLTLGCDAYVLANSLQLIVSQRLIRRLCRECKTPRNMDEINLVELGLSKQLLGEHDFFGPVGCGACNQTGYFGRIGVFELLEPDYLIREMILDGAPGLHIQNYAVERGMATVRENATKKAQMGVTSLEEIARVTDEEEGKKIQNKRKE